MCILLLTPPPPSDPVSPVDLTVNSVSSSSDLCNLTVTWGTKHAHISSIFTCDTTTCYQEGGEQSEVTTSGASLHVYLSNLSVICDHSNQVSWTRDMKNIEHICAPLAVKTERESVDDHLDVFLKITLLSLKKLIIDVTFSHQEWNITSQKENEYFSGCYFIYIFLTTSLRVK